MPNTNIQTQTTNLGEYIDLFSKLALITIFTLVFSITAAFAGTNDWENQELKVKGTWSIEKRVDGNYFTLSEDFKTKRAPDLKIFVSKADYKDITGKNATENSKLVAKLISTKGGQSYKIPDGVNLNEFNSVIIHCEQYSKLWASTPLK